MNTDKLDALLPLFIRETNRIYKCDVSSKSRVRADTDGRGALCHLLRNKGMSFGKIGALLGGRDHATMLHAEKQHKNFMQTDKRYRDKFLQLMLAVNNPGEREKILLDFLKDRQAYIITELRVMGFDNDGIAAFINQIFEKSKHAQLAYEF